MEDVVELVFLTSDIMLNKNEVTLEVDLIRNICWKGQLSQEDIITEAFYSNYFIGKIT